MEKNSFRALISVVLILLPIGILSGGEVKIGGKVGYISGNTVYIDVGRADGIAIGDTVDAVRGEVVIGKLWVINTATNASSCEPLFPVENVRVGDDVVIFADVSPVQAKSQPAEPIEPVQPERKNRLRGRVTLGSFLSEDLTDSGLDFSQPSLSSRITVTDIAGKPLHLKMRHRSRFYRRDRNLAGETARDRWTHQVFQLALEYDDERVPYRFEIGRILPSTPRGIGYIDGMLVEYHPRERFLIGVAGGTRPDLLNAGFQTGEATFGLYAGSEHAVGEGGIASYSTAFVGNYRSGSVNREYVVLEGDYSSRNRLTASGSLEMDLNRGWKGRREDLLDVTSIFLNTRYQVKDGLSANLSYDTRRSPMTLDSRSVPDSLFDDSFRKGLHAGTSWTISSRVRVSGNTGVRFREDADNTYSVSGSIRVREFPTSGVVTNARLQYFQSIFSRGYRPTVGFALSPIRDLRVNLRVGDFIYDIGGDVIHTPRIGSTLNYWLSRRRFLSLSFDGYLAERNRSFQLFAETGLLL